MDAAGSNLLGDVAARTEAIEIACRACPRHGLLNTDKLLADHGEAMPMPALPRLLAGDCPRLVDAKPTARCDVRCPTLSSVWPGR
jgi:hypothetical protein